MCARYSLFADAKIVADTFRLRSIPDLLPRYNIAPTQFAPVIRADENGEQALEQMRWGLVPSWAKDLSIGTKMINARAETLTEKPAYRAAYKCRRCAVPTTGFYEWRGEKGAKQPFLFQLIDSEVFALAGLWEQWNGPDGQVRTFTIVTTEPNEMLAEYHNRMPVVLAPQDVPVWIDCLADVSIAPFPAEAMTARPVSRALNKPGFDDPSCIEHSSLFSPN